MAVLSVIPGNPFLRTFLMEIFNLGILKMSVIPQNQYIWIRYFRKPLYSITKVICRHFVLVRFVLFVSLFPTNFFVCPFDRKRHVEEKSFLMSKVWPAFFQFRSTFEQRVSVNLYVIWKVAITSFFTKSYNISAKCKHWQIYEYHLHKSFSSITFIGIKSLHCYWLQWNLVMMIGLS